jgi:hypothetical protein
MQRNESKDSFKNDNCSRFSGSGLVEKLVLIIIQYPPEYAQKCWKITDLVHFNGPKLPVDRFSIVKKHLFINTNNVKAFLYQQRKAHGCWDPSKAHSQPKVYFALKNIQGPRNRVIRLRPRHWWNSSKIFRPAHPTAHENRSNLKYSKLGLVSGLNRCGHLLETPFVLRLLRSARDFFHKRQPNFYIFLLVWRISLIPLLFTVSNSVQTFGKKFATNGIVRSTKNEPKKQGNFHRTDSEIVYFLTLSRITLPIHLHGWIVKYHW